MAESEERFMAAHGFALAVDESALREVATGHPEYATHIKSLAEWIESHCDSMIDPRELSKAFPTFDPGTLTKVFQLLAKTGRFRRVYKVVTPSGMLSADYDEPPKTVPGQSSYDVVPLLKPRR